MYEPGKILYVGGGSPPTKYAEIIDLNDATPTWRFTGSMAFPRRQMNATLLPTGDVLVTGGTSSPGFNDPTGPSTPPSCGTPPPAVDDAGEQCRDADLSLDDAAAAGWTRAAHGSGDAGGAADERSYEIFSPPYLFKGPRPSITSASPGVVAYGQSILVETPDAASIAKVTLIRLGSVTHAFDQAQRLVPLSFTRELGGVSVQIPASRTVATPGPYLVFLVNGGGVPSEGQILRLQ